MLRTASMGERDRENDHSARNDVGWRRMVRNFAPAWFTITMGTGIVAILLFEFPYNASWLYWLSVIAFCLNIALFFAFSVISLVRYALWPEIWTAMVNHPVEVLYLGAFPVSLSAVINMIVFVCVPAWGEWTIYVAWGMWMASAVLSMVVAIYIPFLIVNRSSETSLRSITAVHCIPSIACIVASATAGFVASALPNDQQAVATVIIGYILWGVGVLPAFMILGLYFARLALCKLPPRDILASSFIPIGPLNMGAVGIMQLGDVAMKHFEATNTIHPRAGEMLYVFGVICALLLWSFTLLWLFIVMGAVFSSRRFPFNLSWWSLVFPIGTFCLSSDRLAVVIPSRFFQVVGAVTSVALFLLWIVVATLTVRDLLAGGHKVLISPCLKDLAGSDDTTLRNAESHESGESGRSEADKSV